MSALNGEEILFKITLSFDVDEIIEFTLKFSSPSRLTQSRADSSMVLLGELLHPPPLVSGYTFNDPLVLPCSSELCPPAIIKCEVPLAHLAAAAAAVVVFILPMLKAGFQVRAAYWSQVISASSETGPAIVELHNKHIIIYGREASLLLSSRMKQKTAKPLPAHRTAPQGRGETVNNQKRESKLVFTGQRQCVGRSSKVHDPGVVDFEAAASDPAVVAIVFGAKQIARAEMINEELHDLGSSLRCR